MLPESGRPRFHARVWRQDGDLDTDLGSLAGRQKGQTMFDQEFIAVSGDAAGLSVPKRSDLPDHKILGSLHGCLYLAET